LRYGALVLTLDEELHIEACLASLAGADPIVVIDSGSTDGTLRLIERSFPGAIVVRRSFGGFADQRNHGLRHCFQPGDWVLHLDADERMTPALVDEIRGLAPAREVAYNIAALTFLQGRPIPRASGYPVYQTRLTRAGAFEFEEVGHGQKAPLSLGRLPVLTSAYHHFPFEKGWDDWRRRHERYARHEAARLSSASFPPWRDAVRDPIALRRWLRRATLRMPLRPWLVWAYLFFACGGILEGSAGREYCRRRRLYEKMIGAELRG
jgi:glycosyltransferase involved in cell wall biosynthesis